MFLFTETLIVWHWFSVQSIQRKISEVIVYYAFVKHTPPHFIACLHPVTDGRKYLASKAHAAFFCSKFRRWEEVAKGQRTLWLLLFHPKNTHRWAQVRIVQFFLTKTQLSYLPSFISCYRQVVLTYVSSSMWYKNLPRWLGFHVF